MVYLAPQRASRPRPVTDPDEDILALARGGDRDQAIRLVMQRHGGAVYRFVRSALRDRPSVDDVHSRVFIEADRDLPRFAGRAPLRSWLFGIARHRVLDQLKSEQGREDRLEPLDGVDVATDAPSPDEALDDALLRRALVECLDKLQPEVRQAVLLRYQQGFTFEDMSDVCNEKPGTLQARVSRALPALKSCIERRTRKKV